MDLLILIVLQLLMALEIFLRSSYGPQLLPPWCFTWQQAQIFKNYGQQDKGHKVQNVTNFYVF